jgi:hypothetical protein
MKENQCAKRIHKIHGEKYTKKNALTMKIPAPHGHPFLKFTTPLSSISSDFQQLIDNTCSIEEKTCL